uniref:Mitochondrial carrier protein n=1 Tax=Corethron hystrix TaxID=216773 RepID=A0A7S1FTK7_9STRA|mmetsp:Transcript_27850/g.63777  ORF Transcript_27850/g.63777 Transcript_27850/m.63777 type:complete len:419 (+) Transcript_27850:32-1288(+)
MSADDRKTKNEAELAPKRRSNGRRRSDGSAFPIRPGGDDYLDDDEYDGDGVPIDNRSLAVRLTRRLSHVDDSSSRPSTPPAPPPPSASAESSSESRALAALKQLFCGGVAGSVAKTVTAPLSRLTILFQVHPMVTTKAHAPSYADGVLPAARKVLQREGLVGFWKGNGTSVLHRFPYSAINFYVYETMLDRLKERRRSRGHPPPPASGRRRRDSDYVRPRERFIAGATAGTAACVTCYPLDLVRTRLATQLPGLERYRGIVDALTTIWRKEGLRGLYSGQGATLMVAIPNFAVSYSVYGTLKEYALDDDLFYNLRRVDDVSGETKLGLTATLFCGAASGGLSACLTFPFDTVRRRMQIQSLHVERSMQVGLVSAITGIVKEDGVGGLYRGLRPELLKVLPMVGTMFFVYEGLKSRLAV